MILFSGADSSKCVRIFCNFTFKNLNDSNTFLKIAIQKGQKFKDICKCDSLTEFVQYDFKKYYEPIKTFSLISDNQTILNGNVSAMQMEYTSSGGESPFHYLITWIKNNDIFYRIVYQSDNNNFNQFLSNIKTILNTIELFDPDKKLQTVASKDLPPLSERKQPSFMAENNNKETTTTTDTLDKESSEVSSSKIKDKKTTVEIDDSTFDLFYSSPESHISKKISITGKIFNTMAPSGDSGGLQIYHLGNQDKDTIISYSLSQIGNSFIDDECVKIEGSAGPTYQYTNAFGAYRTSPMIFASSIQKIDCLDMVDPKAKIIPIGQSLEKGGIKVTLNKVEFDDKNTRAFLTIENTNDDEDEILRFYDTSNSKAFQGKRQYEAQYSSSYPDISSSIPPGIEESGVVLFEPLEYGMDTKLEFDMSIGLDDYKFVFNTNTIDQLNNQIDINQFEEDEDNAPEGTNFHRRSC